MKKYIHFMAVLTLLPAVLWAKQVPPNGALHANQFLQREQRPFVHNEIYFAGDYTQRVDAIRIERAFIAYSGHLSAMQVCQAYLQALRSKFHVDAKISNHTGCIVYPSSRGDDRVRLAMTANQAPPWPVVYTVAAVFTVCRPAWHYNAYSRICYLSDTNSSN